jgi:peptidyl-prolyl cis-trans isomerase A (cyclophilin A)/peptidyl-prolyl cis-trans isomerase B (cyclophilin B)
MKIVISLLMLVLSHSIFAAQNPTVLMDTSKGQITLELFPNEAPKTVQNFLAYIKKDGYQKTTFHRVINGFMIQGGGFSAETGAKVSTLASIENESTNGVSNKRGTISMARTNAPHSASRQFFINHKDNAFLDAQGSKWGYAVFGEVTQGMDVVDAIANVKTGSGDKPRQAVIINSIKVVDSEMK